jgi:hypothetical protein
MALSFVTFTPGQLVMQLDRTASYAFKVEIVTLLLNMNIKMVECEGSRIHLLCTSFISQPQFRGPCSIDRRVAIKNKPSL